MQARSSGLTTSTPRSRPDAEGTRIAARPAGRRAHDTVPVSTSDQTRSESSFREARRLFITSLPCRNQAARRVALSPCSAIRMPEGALCDDTYMEEECQTRSPLPPTAHGVPYA